MLTHKALSDADIRTLQRVSASPVTTQANRDPMNAEPRKHCAAKDPQPRLPTTPPTIC